MAFLRFVKFAKLVRAQREFLQNHRIFHLTPRQIPKWKTRESEDWKEAPYWSLSEKCCAHQSGGEWPKRLWIGRKPSIWTTTSILWSRYTNAKMHVEKYGLHVLPASWRKQQAFVEKNEHKVNQITSGCLSAFVMYKDREWQWWQRNIIAELSWINYNMLQIFTDCFSKLYGSAGSIRPDLLKSGGSPLFWRPWFSVSTSKGWSRQQGANLSCKVVAVCVKIVVPGWPYSRHLQACNVP